MRVLLLALCMALPVLSGCIAFPVEEEAAPPAPEPTAWTALAEAATGRDRTYGFVVPEDATGLRLLRGGNGTEEGLAGGHLFDRLPPMVTLFAPDGARLVTSTPDGLVAAAAPAPGLLFHDPAPAPGLYRVVRYGGMELPPIEVESEGDVTSLSLFPLPEVLERRHLRGSWLDAPATLGEAGAFLLPDAPAVSWVSMIGTGTEMRLTLRSNGTVVDEARDEMLVRTPGGLEGFTFMEMFLDPPRHTRLRPERLGDDAEWHLSGQGSVDAFVWTLSVPKTHLPLVTAGPVPEPGREETLLSGALEPRLAAVLTLPAGADLVLVPEHDERRAPPAFRLYDQDGTRVSWGTLAGPTGLPLGKAAGADVERTLILVNDGGVRLEAVVVGAAPADATLRTVKAERVDVEVDIGGRGGHTGSVDMVSLPGPVLAWHVSPDFSSTATDVVVRLERDRAGVAHAVGYGHEPGDGCCRPPLLGSLSGDPRLLDGGGYDVLVSATSGAGELTLRFYTVDLDDLAETDDEPEDDLWPVPTAPGTAPQLP
ncbi:MAG: hypothetical protein KY455_08350 [Euryarchaeota archaeon]|nr:hypothetical protein [Euryarchaeota archaeon]